jgi:hypothetical protein
LLLCWIGHAGFVLTYYYCVLTLGDSASEPIPQLTEHFLLVPIGLVIQALPGLPGGIGLGELGFGSLYEWFGCAAKMAVAGSLVQRVVSGGLGLLGYLVYLRMRPVVAAVVQKKTTGPIVLSLSLRLGAEDTAVMPR